MRCAALFFEIFYLEHGSILHACALAGNIDTIQELTDILIADTSRLLDESSRSRHILNIIAL